jgi:ABC-type glycerol-3-phosphate transport system permease component
MEAAYIDGASEWKVLLSIMLPLVKTIFLSIMIIHFVDIWNDYQTVLLYLPSHPTIALSVYRRATSVQALSAGTEIKMASCLIMVIPTITIFAIFKDRLMGNLSMGGIKG